MSGFNGNTSSSARNKAQVRLADSIGNAGTRPRSIDLAIRIENKTYERSGSAVNDHYNTHITKLVEKLKDPQGGLMLQQSLLAGFQRPDKFVEENVTKKKISKPKAKKKKKVESKEKTKKKDTPGDYYFFRSTDKEEAKKYQPRQLTQPAAPREVTPTAAKATSSQDNAANLKAAPSAWNKAGTWEERNLTPFTHKRLKELLEEKFTPYTSGHLEVEVEKWTVDGDASLVLVRGKRRLGYELTLTADFKGTYQDEKVEGSINLPSFDMQESTDGDFEVLYDIKKPALNTPKYSGTRTEVYKMTATLATVLAQVAEEVRAKATQL